MNIHISKVYLRGYILIIMEEKVKAEEELNIEIKFKDLQNYENKFIFFVIDKILENIELVRSVLDELESSKVD